MITICLVLFSLSWAQAHIGFSSIPCTRRSPKIVGGLEAQRNEMPFIVSLTRRGGHFCGATIIHERWLLTAGHCVCNGLNKVMKPNQIQGVVGLHSISGFQKGIAKDKRLSTPIKVDIKSIVAHPEYRCANTRNDIALLELVQPIKFLPYIQPICLTSADEIKSYENALATVSGWGWTEENQADGQRADTLRKAAVKIWKNDICERSYQSKGKSDSFIAETQLCAGFENGGIDSCWADSGGPLTSSDNVLIGVVSTGIGCARPGLPGIYTRVSKYIFWIESVIVTNN